MKNILKEHVNAGKEGPVKEFIIKFRILFTLISVII